LTLPRFDYRVHVMGLGKHIRAKFIAGLVLLIPLLVTAYVAYLVISFLDELTSPLVGRLTESIAGEPVYVPGTGLLLFLLIVYLTGVLASNYAGKQLFNYGGALLRRIPFIKGIYSSTKDMMEAFSSEKAQAFKEVVLAEFPSKGRYAMGFITRHITSGDGRVCSVFVPTTPNPTSGYLIYIPEEELVFLDLTVEEAIKHIVSLGTTKVDLKWKGKSCFTG